MDAFSAALGTRQGRLESDDQAAFVLGTSEPGWLAELDPGDRAEIVQAVDLTGVDLVRARLLFSVPATVPPGQAWEASLMVAGAKFARSTCRPGRTREIELAANVARLSGRYEVGVRLELVVA